jgi:phosphinothricin acetyltransferase
MQTRPASLSDAAAIARIYNQGIDDRIATFETRHRSAADIEKWFDGEHPIVVVESDGEVVAFACTSTYRPRECYAGVAEYSVYVEREHRGKGAGREALVGLIEAAERAGFWKLVSRIFPSNRASIELALRVGFRVVGTYEKHGRLDGKWLDAVIVERLIDANIRDAEGTIILPSDDH